MIARARLVLAALLTSALLAPGVAHAAGSPQTARGRALYMANNCYLCHGTVGQGGAGPAIAPPALPALTAFVAFVRRPNPPDMPPYTSAVVSDADLAAIHAYLASIPPPPAALPPALAHPAP